MPTKPVVVHGDYHVARIGGLRYRLKIRRQFPNRLSDERIGNEEYQEAKVFLSVRRRNEGTLSKKDGFTRCSRPRSYRSLPRRSCAHHVYEVIGLRPDAKWFILHRTVKLGEEDFPDLESLRGRIRANDFKGIQHGLICLLRLL